MTPTTGTQQVVWNPEKGERDPLTLICSSIASQPLIPRQAVMGALGPRDHRRGRSRGSGESCFRLDLQMLTMQTQARSPLAPSGPVSSEERSRTYWQRMEQHADLTRFGRGAPVPLALCPRGARTAIANAGGIDDPQTAIMRSPALMGDQDVACWAAQGPIRLEGKVCPGKAASFPGGRSGRWSISRGGRGGSRWGKRRGGALVLLWEGGRKLGGAYRFRQQLVPWLQAEVPRPLSNDLPGFLSPGRVATPAIGFLFEVFVFQSRFKGTTVQVEGHHITGFSP